MTQPSNMLRFTRLTLNDWRQFERVDVSLHPKLTILTGSNGAGKSTILNIFAQHFGFSRPYLSTPKVKKEGGYVYDSGIYKMWEHLLVEDDQENEDFEKLSEPPPIVQPGAFNSVREITYSNGITTEVGFHENQSQSYGLIIPIQQHVAGVNIGSHRMIPNYQPVQNLSFQPMLPAQAFASFNQEVVNRFMGGHTGFSPTYRMKESLIAMAAFGEGNSYLQSNSEVLQTFIGFIEILKTVLPDEVGFETLVVRVPDIVLRTKSGDFILDSSSGGVNALIELSWQIYLFSMINKEFSITIDEPENHLHPTMQKQIIPSLMKAFPDAQFIVATHSPFIVSSVEDSFVYVLRYNTPPVNENNSRSNVERRRRVTTTKLDNFHKGGSAGEILREVLGVAVTIPEWVQGKIDLVITKYSSKPFSNETLNELRSELAEMGFGELYPDALSQLVKAIDKTN